MNIVRKALLASTLAATAMVSATPAMARDGHRGGNDTAAIAIGAGIIGLAIGALATSGRNDRYDDRYYVSDGWYYNDNAYYNRSGERYSRHDWQRRYGNNYQHRGYSRDGWNGQRSGRDGWNGRNGDYRGGREDGYYQRRGY